MIPQANPKAGYLAHKDEIEEAILRVLDNGRYILGPEVAAFEREFASYLGVRHAVGVASGTDALELALRASSVDSGDLVFTVSHTAVATVAAIELAKATPILVDINPETYTMDPESLEEAVTNASRRIRPSMNRPKAIIPVHLYGQPADMQPIVEIAQRHGLYVIEDCAQAHGADIQGRKVGCWCDIAAFSFYPTKNLGALGDGGMIVTNNDELAERAHLIREYGWRDRYISDIPGKNSRLDEIQAAMLRIKLRYLDSENLKRLRIANLYDQLLEGASVKLPQRRPGFRHVFHQYVIQSERRDGLKEFLRKKEVMTAIHYPLPVHLQPAYKERLLSLVTLERTEEIVKKVLSLPMYPQLEDGQVEVVANHVQNYEKRT